MFAMDYDKPEVVPAPVNESSTHEAHGVSCPSIVPDIEYASSTTLNEPVNMGNPKERRGIKLW
jgi:hypothetical protein